MRTVRWSSLFLVIASLAVAGCDGSKSTRPAPTAGLVVTDLVVGTGPSAQNGDTLVTNFQARLTDSTAVASTDGKPSFRFVLGAGTVIRGWDLGLVGIRASGTRRLDIPPELAYGATGYPPVIPPNARVVFDVLLVELRAMHRP